ncbi:ea7ee97a-975c-452b-996c-c8042ee3fc34 [Thermothielavioides terrestris]|uniref:Ea7ee97a-975c-452b-996c-c8042ee3fc34 n=1 Tax=Thermothielavioides terrestris TaxID=2587410 RepID=A0A3S4D121_9PEZI|nr:ea7ee97a-975c-452b-996c-c8042ee3fc34 [Thermothielavioides terrestris]
MAPPSGLHHSAVPSDFETPYPPLVRSSTVPASLRSHRADPSHLAPEDAYAPLSPHRHPGAYVRGGDGSGTDARPRRVRRDDTSRSRSRRRKRFQKLLWVKQSYPDNYTDQATFLENLQRNPRVRPYDFWPLVADSTVIVQHVCSVIIFVVCFVGIFQERVSPVSVVGWGSFATFLGWLLWDWWVSHETHEGSGDDVDAERQYRQHLEHVQPAVGNELDIQPPPGPAPSPSALQAPSSAAGSSTLLVPGHAPSRSVSSVNSIASQGTNPNSPTTTTTTTHRLGPDGPDQPPTPSPTARNSRAYVRVSTIKSAILIYFTLLGLSPILKSLTRSTSSDSIWAMSFWLLVINIFFFDYSGSSWVGSGSGGGGGTRGKRMPVASLSTNAALMASTVLASRLPSTGQVFSLTLFSIEVFGLFPVFRQYARHRSRRYHVSLTVLLVLGAGAGVGMVLGDDDAGGWPWKRGLLGMLVGCLIAVLAMGGCAWWLIGLQKYKNEIYGPWDPARPIIISRRHWDDD